MTTHYKEFFRPKPDYKPVMTKEAINEKPDNWLNFYPHETFVGILRALFQKFESGDRSIWIYGAYGTGKSHAALVIQKLLMDGDERVGRYCKEFSRSLPPEVVKSLEKWRRAKTLVVYETGTDTVYTPQQLLVGIERAVLSACKEQGYEVPSLSGLDRLLERVRDDESRFFRKRDEIQRELAHLTPDITTYAQFEAKCRKDNGRFAGGLLQDAEKVLEHDNVFLMPGAEAVLDWIDAIRRANGIGKVVFLWDEFSSYIDHAKSDLKTFEKLAEQKAQQCGFHFIPVTHMSLDSFLAAGSESAKKAKDRYTFMPLQIPANQVFRLGAHAFEHLNEAEWRRERDGLWSDVRRVVESYMAAKLPASEAVAPDDFKAILPLHPMCAYMLRHMAELVGSNQRSFFDYLCTTGGESEFQKFLEEGGPAVPNRQYLMVDYLWRYFMERRDLGLDPAVQDIEAEFNSKKSACRIADGSPEERVFKATLMYALMQRKSGAGVQELLAPTVENIEKSFYGDGAVVNVKAILEELERKNCFTISAGRIMPLISGVKVDPSGLRGQFTTLAAARLGEDLQRKVDGFAYSSARYEVRAWSGTDFKPSDVKNRGEFGEGTPKGGNRILLNFLLARDREGIVAIPEKARQMARQFAGMRMAFIYFDNASFCDDGDRNWEDFILLKAQAEKATDQAMRNAYDQRAKAILDKWKTRLVAGNTDITMVVPADHPGEEPTVEQGLAWGTLKAKLEQYKFAWFPFSPDQYALGNITLLTNKATGLKNWALTGLTGQSPIKGGGGTFAGYLRNLTVSKGVSFADDWFDKNPEHPFTKIKEFWDKKRQNTIGAGNPCSIRRQYIELQRAPYGLEKNAFSAFVLGFTLRSWLEKNLQWTDGRVSQPLDAETLADIIEKTVQADGAEIRDEKLVCRLSAEEKAFTKEVSSIFALRHDPSATPESVLALIGERVRTLTGNIPLWTLPPYIKSLGTETAEEDITKVMSSRTKDGSKTEKIKEIGGLLLGKEGLSEAIRNYITQETFLKAFDRYLGEKAPGLLKSAESAGDIGCEYRKAVISRFAMDASWLWNETDVSDVLKDAENQYRFILAMQELFAVGSWMDFAAAQTRLSDAMTKENKVSLEILASTHPYVSELAAQAKDGKIQGDALDSLCTTVELRKKEIAELFRDPARKMQIELLVRNLGAEAADTTAEEWKAILDARQGGAEMNESDFRNAILVDVQKFRSKSEGRRLAALWKEKTGSESPDDWAREHSLPADSMFADMESADVVIGVMQSLSETPVDRIKAAFKTLKAAKITNKAGCGANFLERNFPKRYRRLGVKAEALAEAFKRALGDAPNRWRSDPRREDAALEFVRENYNIQFRPRLEERIRGMSGADAKAELLKLIASVPDAGLALME